MTKHRSPDLHLTFSASTLEIDVPPAPEPQKCTFAPSTFDIDLPSAPEDFDIANAGLDRVDPVLRDLAKTPTQTTKIPKKK